MTSRDVRSYADLVQKTRGNWRWEQVIAGSCCFVLLAHDVQGCELVQTWQLEQVGAVHVGYNR